MSKTSHILSKQNSQQPKQFRGGEKKVMKKSLSLLVAIAMVFSMFATLVSADGKAAGQKLQDLGIIKGTSAGLDEDKEWLRQDVTVLLARLLGAESQAEAHANTHGFADLDSKFYNGYVSWAKEKGYFNGETDTRFGVGNPITNQQFAAVLLRVLNVDVEYAEAFDKAVELELVSADLDKAANAVRGNIYESLVTALDFKIDGKKLGTILGLKGYEITDLELVKASAAVASAVTLEFNDKVATINNEDVTIQDENGNEVYVSKVTVDGNKATVELAATLTENIAYTVSVAKAVSAENSILEAASSSFTYKKAEAATVEFKNTTVAVGTTLELVVKDADGNDISKDYPSSAFNIVSSQPSVVSIENDGSAKAASSVTNTNYISVVNATLNGNDKVTTGNVIITVREALALNITKLEIGNDKNTVHLGPNNAVTVGTASVEVKDQAGQLVNPTSVSFRSSNPSILVIDQTSGQYRAVQEGSATVTYSATLSGSTVSKSVVVTVRKEAVPTSFDLSVSSVRVVNGSEVPATFDVTVKDQFGEKIDSTVTVTSADTALILDGTVNKITKGEYKVTVAQGNGTSNGNTTLTIAVEGISASKRISASVVSPGTAAGYIVEADGGLTIDSYRHSDVSKAKPESTKVQIFLKDTAGNKIGQIDENDFAGTNPVAKLEPADSKLVKFNGAEISAKAQGVTGTENVKVLYNGVQIGTLAITVVKTSENAIDRVVQNQTSITVKLGTDLQAALVGPNGAFTAYNQYDEKVPSVTANVISSNQNVVAATGGAASLSGNTGTATLNVEIEGKFFVINVVVTN
ncbi:S-layer homology domain-containing protein [Paenibacillus septentrionalis]|uniref:S-layer homology domain-containing protein n=1 Tax=Paenibacillus septentrionalis TaxID=429342 RepID=A0ABW1V8G8_9BACL